MRTIKDHDERKEEILNTAERLFNIKGYGKCTINDILKEVSIAKGTFYYYFKSKEEVMDAIVSRYTDIIMARVTEILNKEEMAPQEKLMNVFLSMKIDNQIDEGMMKEIHKTENALLHQKSLSQIIEVMIPVLVRIVEEGIEKKVWKCRYPVQYMQIFLAASLTLTDGGIFGLDNNSQEKIIPALFSILEKMLELPEGYILNLINQSSKN